ncbi:MAG: aspartate 1-decarboxylase [Bacteroidales bacterium]
MFIELLKAKIHRAVVTEANLHYIGSITIDETLMKAAGIVENEKVQVVNINNGERLETYVIKGEKDSGDICMNGPAARKVNLGDIIIILAYIHIAPEKAESFVPKIIFPGENNKLNPED